MNDLLRDVKLKISIRFLIEVSSLSSKLLTIFARIGFKSTYVIQVKAAASSSNACDLNLDLFTWMDGMPIMQEHFSVHDGVTINFNRKITSKIQNPILNQLTPIVIVFVGFWIFAA